MKDGTRDGVSILIVLEPPSKGGIVTYMRDKRRLFVTFQAGTLVNITSAMPRGGS